MHNGYPDLNMFNTLYWLFFISFVCFSYGIFPLSQQLQGGFPENSVKGQLCMKIDFDLDKMNVKQRILTFIYQIVLGYSQFRYTKMMNDYAKGQNLMSVTFSQFGGKHHRNIFTARETRTYFMLCLILMALDNVMIIIMQVFREHVDKDTRFVLYNFLWVSSLELFIGVFIPVKHLIQSRENLPGLWWNRRQDESIKFYVSQQSVVPRSYVESLNNQRSCSVNVDQSLGSQFPPMIRRNKLNTGQVHALNPSYSLMKETSQSIPNVEIG